VKYRPGLSGEFHLACSPINNTFNKVISMISEQMSTRISAQINREFYSAYFYLALSAQAETADLKGTAAWFMAKHTEEMTHALKMYHYLVDQDAPVQLSGITSPPADRPTA
jgi:ferritin